MRIWGRIIRKNHLIRDTVITESDPAMTRTKKVYHALQEICYEMDLSVPVWLDLNKKDFLRNAKTRFTQDNFVEPVDFDYLDFQVIEEDW